MPPLLAGRDACATFGEFVRIPQFRLDSLNPLRHSDGHSFGKDFMRTLLLGVDSGTQSTKVLVVNAKNGKVIDRKSTRLNSSHSQISYAVFCLKKKKTQHVTPGA